MDNSVTVILKSAYRRISEIGFEDFKIVEEAAEIISITSQLKTINREDGVKLSLKSLKAGQHHIIHLELATHDKEKVLATIAELKKLDMVLIAEPDYIYDIVDDQYLDKEVEKEIEQDFERQYGYALQYDKYYGTYGDCVVIFVEGDAAVIKKITVADSVFEYNYAWEIYVWKNGEFATIEKAYSMGWLSLDDIHTIAYKHAQNANNEQYTAGPFYGLQTAYDQKFLTVEDLQTIADYHNNGKLYPESLSEDIALSVKKDWAKKLNDSKTDTSKTFTESDIAIQRYYGTYNGCVVVIVDRRDAMYIDVYAPIAIEIENVVFNYNLYRPQIVVYKLSD